MRSIAPALRLGAPRLLALGLLLAPLFAVPALGASGGPLGTLMLGSYECERPGAPATPAVAQPEWNFTVTTSSRYRTATGDGTYLLRGKSLQMTSGPLEGIALLRLRGGFLRVVEDGKPGAVRCVLARRSDKH